MHDSVRRSLYLLALNWLLFFTVSLWISIVQGNLLWWLRLRWGSWLSEFSALAQLSSIPAGSIWILWLMTSLVLTALHWLFLFGSTKEQAEENNKTNTTRHIPNADLIDARPELKEKLLRLHQSLERI